MSFEVAEVRKVIVTVLAPFFTRWGTERRTTRSFGAVTLSRSVTVRELPLARGDEAQRHLASGSRVLSVAPRSERSGR